MNGETIVGTGGRGTVLAVLAAALLTLAAIAAAQDYDSYVVTHGVYSGFDDLDAAVKAEFGPDAEVAEWTEIKERFGTSPAVIELFAWRVGLGWNEHLWVTYEGERIFPGSGLLGEAGRTRYYFLSRWDHNKPENYEAHDQIANHFLSLGSWYDLRWPVLVRLR